MPTCPAWPPPWPPRIINIIISGQARTRSRKKTVEAVGA
jgi:hypothetical protein